LALQLQHQDAADTALVVAQLALAATYFRRQRQKEPENRIWHRLLLPLPARTQQKTKEAPRQRGHGLLWKSYLHSDIM